MKNKTNKKNSPNRLKCQISGQERMSNKTYIADKAYKFQTTSAVWASFYINKESYKALTLEVEAGGIQFAADMFKVDKERVIKWLRYNGRGKFVKIGRTPPGHVEKEAVELAA